PSSRAAVACSIAVLTLPPAPAITGTRPAVTATARRTTRACSSADRAWISPVPQAAKTPPAPWSSPEATCCSNAASLTSPRSSKGVSGKNRIPLKSMWAPWLVVRERFPGPRGWVGSDDVLHVSAGHGGDHGVAVGLPHVSVEDFDFDVAGVSGGVHGAAQSTHVGVAVTDHAAAEQGVRGDRQHPVTRLVDGDPFPGPSDLLVDLGVPPHVVGVHHHAHRCAGEVLGDVQGLAERGEH